MDKLGSVEDYYEQLRYDVFSFLHVTPRHNVATIHHVNFYDLVVVGKPGDCRQKANRLNTKQLMQLSSKGLLYRVNEVLSEYIPLDEFLLEKSQVEGLRKLIFFGMFKECRCFSAWRNLARSIRVQKARRVMSQSACFSTEPFVKASLIIGRALQELGQ